MLRPVLKAPCKVACPGGAGMEIPPGDAGTIPPPHSDSGMEIPASGRWATSPPCWKTYRLTERTYWLSFEELVKYAGEENAAVYIKQCSQSENIHICVCVLQSAALHLHRGSLACDSVTYQWHASGHRGANGWIALQT